MTQPTLYEECPLCSQASVVERSRGVYSCGQCGLTLQERSVLGLFKKGYFGVAKLGNGDFALAEAGLKEIVLPPDPLKTVIGNIYSDDQLAEIAGGNVDIIHPVKTVLAQIILEQLNEVCYLNIQGVRRGHGQPLTEESWYIPARKVPKKDIEWLDQGNIFCTNQRIVMPSDRFTFIRLDRKVVAVQAFTDGIALQRKGEAFSTYFAGCYLHESALTAAYVMARVPMVRPPEWSSSGN